MGSWKKTEIISMTHVKPSKPTPPHLQTFKLSLPDQLSPNVYPNMTFFYPYTNTAGDLHHDVDYTDFFHAKSKLLQKALSETLTLFYPLAGRLQDDSTIACNDEGVVFTESKTSYLLSDILASPDFDIIYREFVSTNYHEAKQVSNGSILLFNFILFSCGGTAVSVAASHKVLDLISLMTFFKSLSAACCGYAVPILPDFRSAPALFPSRQMPNFNATFGDLQKFSTRSFVFTASKVQELKTIASNSLKKEGYEFGHLSRVNVVMAFLWQCLLNSFTSQRGSSRSTAMLQAANLRNRLGEALPFNAMGSLALLFATDTVQKEGDVQLSELLKKLLYLKFAIDKRANRVDADELFRILTQENRDIFDKKDEVNIYVGSSWCRLGFYDIDFGMGKPVWITSVAPDILTNCINLLDTKEEGGIEALVYLKEEEMQTFESNQKLLQFAVPRTIDMH